MITQSEDTLDHYGFKKFVFEKLNFNVEVLVRQKQGEILTLNLEELIKERNVCRIIVNSMSNVPSLTAKATD